MMVKAWKERVTIPTYMPGKPEKNPIFLEKRVYQGSSGVVYPYPVIEKIADEKTDVEYDAVWLENEYIKVMILPSLGGRVQMAYDKIRKRHFIYYNHVIKPALVGLAGPWISGGIEFNWPQHHRPSTFMPVDSCIEENSDGSVTVWVNERERMFSQKGMAGFTLRPGKAYLEIKGVLYNPTPMPQTFLWWANPAVAVNDAYQSVFPADVNAVFDHGKRAVSTFPIATGVYYKMDYSAGVDISNYRNIKVPTSYMAVNSKYDFEGGYENDTHAGMLHVASHHVSPGKKQWTWGNGDFGRAWDRNLTDEDGPYIELMAGVYTENQPDFSWLMPYEEKTFTQYFLPYRELGVVKNATRDLLLNILPAGEGKAALKVFATSAQRVRVEVKAADGTVLYDTVHDITPEELLDITIDTKGFPAETLGVVLSSEKGRELLSWEPETNDRPVPDAAQAALRPKEIDTVEQLYLTGLHLEQYRHATFNPVDYYEEGLRREPDDVRCNNALGLWYIRKGRFDKAEGYLRRAVKVLTRRNPNPYDGEPAFNLGLCLKMLGRTDEAYDNFYKASWNGGWQDAAYFECAQLSCGRGNYEDALYEVDRSLLRNWHSFRARALKTHVLNRLGRDALARAFAKESLGIDPFNFACLYETGQTELMREMMRGDANDYNQLALDYCGAYAWREAADIWRMAIAEGATDSMTAYYLAWAEENAGETPQLRRDADVNDMSFPTRIEAIPALEAAMRRDSGDAVAPYLLGNLYYDKRQYDLAFKLWSESAKLNPAFPTVWRNLALITFNKLHDEETAISHMERAFDLDMTDARLFMELDQLYKRLGRDHSWRLEQLSKHMDLVESRDDLLLEYISLLNYTGRNEDAAVLIQGHLFHPWEGGEGKVPAQYQYSRVVRAHRLLASSDKEDIRKAATLLEECLEYPHNLGEGKLYGALENDFQYLLGLAYSKLGDVEKARAVWQKGTVAPMEPAAALYYNDAAPDKLFYAGMCERALGNEEKASERFNRLIEYSHVHLDDDCLPDYFAVSLPDLLIWDNDLTTANKVHCHYMRALGQYGLGEKDASRISLQRALAINPNHTGALAFKSFFEAAEGI